MTVVRELITRLGWEVDQASFRSAEKAYDALTRKVGGSSSGGPSPAEKAAQATQQAADKAKDAVDKTKQAAGGLGETLAMIGRQLAALGIGAKLMQFVELASDANETASAIKQLFGGEGAKQVDEWSHAMGEAMGRSAYDLQQYVARLGSVLGPVTKTQEQARLMSESLAGLAVDLGSFFNTSDQDAMMALRSGLTGEYESLKRYGVVINEATLAEVAHTKGIKKKVSQMTVAEKTELRYAAIMERTKQAQGDAARTGEGYANASKALQAELKTLGIDMARKVIPAFEVLVRVARTSIKWFNEMRKSTKVLEAAFVVLGTTALWLGRETLTAFALPLAAVGALILLVDELWNLFTGGQSVIGDWIDKTFGIGKTNALVEGTIKFFEKLGHTIDIATKAINEFLEKMGDLQGFFEYWENRFTATQESAGVFAGDAVARGNRWLLKPVRDLQNKIAGELRSKGYNVPDWEDNTYERRTGRSINADVMERGWDTFKAARWNQLEDTRRAGVQSRADAEEMYQQELAAAVARGEILPGTAYGVNRRRQRAAIAAATKQPDWSVSPEDAAAQTAALYEPSGGMSSLPGVYDVGAVDQSISDYAAAAVEAAAAAPNASTMPENMSVSVSMPAPVINIIGDPPVIRRTVEQVIGEQRKAGIAAIPRRGGS